MAEKKQDFVVSDRRRFGAEGEPRPDVPVAEEEKPAPTPASPAPTASTSPEAKAEQIAPQVAEEQPAGDAGSEQEMPPPPTASEQQEQKDAYTASGKKLEDLFSKSGGRRESLPEMTFERLIESFYMTALLQLGAIRHEGEQ